MLPPARVVPKAVPLLAVWLPLQVLPKASRKDYQLENLGACVRVLPTGPDFQTGTPCCMCEATLTRSPRVCGFGPPHLTQTSSAGSSPPPTWPRCRPTPRRPLPGTPRAPATARCPERGRACWQWTAADDRSGRAAAGHEDRRSSAVLYATPSFTAVFPSIHSTHNKQQTTAILAWLGPLPLHNLCCNTFCGNTFTPIIFPSLSLSLESLSLSLSLSGGPPRTASQSHSLSLVPGMTAGS
eukprot:SAG22_NODE_306_length_12671_cov_14.743239_13_plen_240_part_00